MEPKIENLDEYRASRYETSQQLIERIALRIYQGDAADLAKGINEVEVVIEFNRATAAHALAEILRAKLRQDGYVVMSSIDFAEEEFLTGELTDYGPDNVRQLASASQETTTPDAA